MTTPADGTPYLPSNYTVGMEFHESWCDRCARHGPPDPQEICGIWAASHAGEVVEWTWQDGEPMCSHFVAVPPGPDDPPPFDPRQQVLELEAS